MRGTTIILTSFCFLFCVLGVHNTKGIGDGPTMVTTSGHVLKLPLCYHYE